MPAQTERRRVLLVEDDELVRDLVRECLEGAGHSVTSCASGEEAVRLAALGAERFDLVVTDLVMPGGMGGRELVARLRTNQPGMRVLFISGAADSGAFEPGSAVLYKPFSPGELTAAAQRSLSEPPLRPRPKH
jgi:CheY-like chemotaxis protein